MKLHRKIAVFLSALLLLFVPVSGCGTGKRTVTDGLGHKITLEGTPERIVSLSPALTETVFALGAGDRLVGVTEFCNRPPEAELVEKVGDAFNLNQEKLVSLKPDLVLVAGTRDFESQSEKDVKRLGIPVYASGPSTVEEVISEIESLAKALDLEKSGKQLAEKLRDELDRTVSALPPGPENRPSVFVALDQDLWTVAPGSFIHELLSISGGENIVGDAKEQYLQISMEELLQKNPDVILIAVPQDAAGALALKPGWDRLKAVAEGRVYFPDPDLISRPGPGVVDGIKELVSWLYPQE